MSKQAKDKVSEKPKRPMNGYFTFRGEKMKEGNSSASIKGLWESLDSKARDIFNDGYKQEMEVWRKNMIAWEKIHGKVEKKVKKSVEKEISKPEKEKGAKSLKIKEKENPHKKVEEEPKRVEKSKGKSKK